MITVLGRKRGQNCAGLARRDFLRASFLGLAGLSAPGALSGATALTGRSGPPKSVIMFWLDGGLSHLESYDPKPEAPVGYRGPFGATATSVPGIRVSEMLPGQARCMKKLALLRSVHHQCSEHWSGPHTMLTGVCGPTFVNPAQTHPSAGSIVARACGPNRPNMPPYVATPSAFHSFQKMAPGYHSASYLGTAFNPFSVLDNRPAYTLKGDELKPVGLKLPPDVTIERLQDRRDLLGTLDNHRRALETAGTPDPRVGEAFSILADKACHRAFDLDKEDPRYRDRYGRNYVGQSALLARRLVEAGVTFVTVCHADWDHHADIERLLRIELSRLDQAVSRLVEDLDERGMLDQVLVLVMGDFGRTPLMNNTGGRDHWSETGSVLMAGGGIKGGQTIGATNSRGEHPIDRPVQPADIWATVYHALGIKLDTHYRDYAGRPTPITTGSVIRELLS